MKPTKPATPPTPPKATKRPAGALPTVPVARAPVKASTLVVPRPPVKR